MQSVVISDLLTCTDHSYAYLSFLGMSKQNQGDVQINTKKDLICHNV